MSIKVLQLTVRPVTALAAAIAPCRSHLSFRLRSARGYAWHARAAPDRPAAENNVRCTENHMRRMMAIASVVLISGCSMTSNSPPASDADLRKARTEAFLQQRSVPINPTLPLVESATETQVREPGAIAKRAVVLLGVIAVGHGVPRREVVAWLKAENIWASVSPSEAEFLQHSESPKQSIIDATWRTEALWTLLWSLQKVDDLDFPTGLCDMEHLQSSLPGVGESTAVFIDSAQRRSIPEILDATDMAYRTHWAVVDARLSEQPTPAGLNSGVVVERHYALNWLVFYAEEWDDITTDT